MYIANRTHYISVTDVCKYTNKRNIRRCHRWHIVTSPSEISFATHCSFRKFNSVLSDSVATELKLNANKVKIIRTVIKKRPFIASPSIFPLDRKQLI